MDSSTPILAAEDVSKRFAAVTALDRVSIAVRGGETVCLLGDNGAGKSTLIKILAGLHRPDAGVLRLDGRPVELGSPRAALDVGIATVYQDLAMIPLLTVVRNFYLGREPKRGRGPFRWIDWGAANRVAADELQRAGIRLKNPQQSVATLSGGERQSVAIARAMYFGARVLILDEPTSALGVREAALVLRAVSQARDHGLGVVFITHNVAHAYAIGERFVVLKHGSHVTTVGKHDVTRDQLQTLMAGGEEIDELGRMASRDVA